MDLNLESSKNNEIKESEEIKVNSEKLSETEETCENFDDCSLNEVKDSKESDASEESLEDNEQDYDDCEAKIEEKEYKNPELVYEDDDYKDCAKESSDQDLEDNTYRSDAEIRTVEAKDEVQKADKESDDTEDLQVINEAASDNELEQLENAELSEKDENIGLDEEAIDEADEDEEDFDDTKEEKPENSYEQDEESLQDRINDALQKDELSASEIKDLRDQHSNELEAKLQENTAIDDASKSKFEEVLSKEKGSDEYWQSLEEYNAIKDKKAELENELASMEKQQELLNKKTIELREAQIQKGSEAMLNSTDTLSGVDKLQERYDESYYDKKPDEAELASIRDDGSSAIKELSLERDSIRQAMDAKMDEISDYVDKYDTISDERYEEMIGEYNAMEKSYDRINYSIVNLDENNRAITERLGDEYISELDRPSVSNVAEVNAGIDVPGETDYFVDEVKASEVLAPFKQGNWEEMNIDEQKEAIEKLADYNAEILAVENKPNVEYYYLEDKGDFGGFSDENNTIYINEYNMGDAEETADTISHEYRHKYQHERAEKLENQRDLEFKEGFDDYISPDDDYEEYKNQLVELDARLYAQAVKDKISSYSDDGFEKIEHSGEEAAYGDEYSTLNPEKGSVFRKVSIDELPEDFERKEIIKYKEVLEADELNELRANVSIYYENGKKIADKIPEFNNYKEHNDIESGHIEKVRVKSIEAADVMETHFRQNDYDGLFSPNIDRRSIEVMSLYHDTGMDGNIRAEDYEVEREAYLSNEEIRERYLAEALIKKEKSKTFDRVAEEEKANKKFDEKGFESHFRSDHSLESAIHVLRDRESVAKYGVNVDKVALGSFVHSKSNSGLENLASEDEWRLAIGRMHDRVDEFNKAHPDEQIYFDSSFLLNKDDSFKQEELAQMRSEAIVLRIGDANGHDTNSRISQNGKVIEFNLEKKEAREDLPGDFKSKLTKTEYEDYFLEVQSADVKVGGVELNNANDKKGVSRMFAVGEGNFKSLSCDVDASGNIRQNFELCDGNAFPISTQKCIVERLGEYKTAKPMTYTAVVKLGDKCSDEVYKSYLEFAGRLEGYDNIKLEVIR